MKLYSVSLIAMLVFVAGCRSARMETAGKAPGASVSGGQGFAGEPSAPTVDPQPAVAPTPLSTPIPQAPAEPLPIATDAGPGEPAPTGGRVILPHRGHVKGCTRITSINGKYDPNHATEIYVRPGEVVNLTADVIDGKSNPLGLAPESFKWSTNLGRGDECFGGQDCLKHSSFQATQYGVAFYVPPQMGQALRITVEGRDPSGRGSRDYLIVRNGDWDGRPRPAPVLVADPRNYPGASFDANIALNGMGRWVVVANVRYFTPYTTALNGQPWAPYRNGYWARDNGGVVTWISYDAHGWITGHYGVWRHHRSYGWLWLPFPDRRYEPHTVSWFNQGEYVGWYPYYKGFPDAYRHRVAEGFDDGYWLDYRVGLGFGSANYAYNPGFAIVPVGQIANANLNGVFVNAQVSFGIVQGAFRRPVYQVPTFLPPAVLPLTTVGFVTTAGGARIMQPTPLHPMPAETSLFLQRLNNSKRALPVGTALQGANLVTPKQNPVPAPVVMDHDRVIGVAPVSGVTSGADAHRAGLPVVPKERVPRLAEGDQAPPAEIAQAAPTRGAARKKR